MRGCVLRLAVFRFTELHCFMRPPREGTLENWQAACSQNLGVEGPEANKAQVGTDCLEHQNFHTFMNYY